MFAGTAACFIDCVYTILYSFHITEIHDFSSRNTHHDVPCLLEWNVNFSPDFVYLISTLTLRSNIEMIHFFLAGLNEKSALALHSWSRYSQVNIVYCVTKGLYCLHFEQSYLNRVYASSINCDTTCESHCFVDRKHRWVWPPLIIVCTMNVPRLLNYDSSSIAIDSLIVHTSENIIALIVSPPDIHNSRWNIAVCSHFKMQHCKLLMLLNIRFGQKQQLVVLSDCTILALVCTASTHFEGKAQPLRLWW